MVPSDRHVEIDKAVQFPHANADSLSAADDRLLIAAHGISLVKVFICRVVAQNVGAGICFSLDLFSIVFPLRNAAAAHTSIRGVPN